VLGIHEIDSLEWELSFERFLNDTRISYPDVDIDVSQREREKVLQHIRDTYETEDTAVLQVAAFARAGARRTIDMVMAAKGIDDPTAGSVAERLKKLLPDTQSITGGTKQEKEISYWLEFDNGKQAEFRELAEGMGWLDLLLKLDGIQTHLAKHAAGVVIIGRDDLKRLPQTSVDGHVMMTGYDMYALDELNYLKIDILGLRTLDIVADAHKFCGGDGSTQALMELWKYERDDESPYALLCDADTQGVFQVETSGYRKTLKEFLPSRFEHIVQLNALYRPGALDAKADNDPNSKRNMVDVFIDRKNMRELVIYLPELRDALAPILDPTQGIILYQEQAMRITVELAGFDAREADNLRKAIGKKQIDRMNQIKPQFIVGMEKNGYSTAAAEQLWQNIFAASRYSWNKSHAVFYGTITWWCAYFKSKKKIDLPYLGLLGPGKAAFYAGLINSLDGDKDRQADAVAEARQHVEIKAPDINIAKSTYTIDQDAIVFGLNGIKGMGEANRNAIDNDRWLKGDYENFEDFHRRLPAVPINMKLSLIKCGAFDRLDGRERLLAVIPKYSPKGEPTGKTWTVAEFIKHNTTLKKPRQLPDITEWEFPSARDLSEGELSTIGFYVSADPMKEVTKALARLDPSSYFGGEIVPGTIRVKPDKRGQDMGWFTLLTTALNKQRCMIFGSNWPQCRQLVTAGARVIVCAYEDGSQLIVSQVFPAGDYRHFKRMVMTRDGEQESVVFDGQFSTVEIAEASGYEVRLS
jgi:DNA polymerase-3 subunit alpha